MEAPVNTQTKYSRASLSTDFADTVNLQIKLAGINILSPFIWAKMVIF